MASEQRIVEVEPYGDNNWKVQAAGGDVRRFSSRKEAVGVATGLARREHSQLIVHGEDGRVEARRDFRPPTEQSF